MCGGCGDYGPTMQVSVVMLGFEAAIGLAIFGFRRTTSRIQGGPHRRVATCAGCRYNMVGLDQRAACPECGRRDARLRHDTDRTQTHWHVDPAAMVVGLTLSTAIITACVLRLSIIQEAVQTRIGFPVTDRYWRDDFFWGHLLMVLVWVTSRAFVRSHPTPKLAGLVCAAAVVGAVGFQTALSGPFVPAQQLKNGANLAAMLSVIGVYGLSWVFARAGARRRMPHATPTPETQPCESSSPTTTASTPPASGPSTVL